MDSKAVGVGPRGPRAFKKKSRNLLGRARHYGKKDQFGRGYPISGDRYHYILQILEVCRNDLEVMDDRDVFVENVFKQFDNEEVNISSNQIGSRLVEQLLPWANDTTLERLLSSFSTQLRLVCCDEFASHVLEHLISVVAMRVLKFFQSGDTTGENEERKEEKSLHYITKMKDGLVKVSRILINNLEEFVFDPFASHVMSVMLQSLSGQEHIFTPKFKKRKHEETKEPLPSIEEFCAIVEECGNRVVDCPLLADMAKGDVSSRMLQSLLHALKRLKKTKLPYKLIIKLLNESFTPATEIKEEDEKEGKKLESNSDVPEIFLNGAGSNLMEVAISVASDKVFTQIYARCFINRLKDMSVMPCSNFCVQRLFAHSRANKEFEAMFDEISPHFGTILDSNNTGVLLAVAKACQRLSMREESFVKHLKKALQCTAPHEDSFVPLVAQLTKYDTWQANCADGARDAEGRTLATLHGSLILQTMLQFSKPDKVVSRFMKMEKSDLQAFACNQFGSHVIQVLFSSKQVTDKHKRILVKKMKGSYVALTISKYGSWPVQTILQWARPELQSVILDELAQSEHVINAHKTGNIISNKFALSLFKRNREDWFEVQKQERLKRKLFADIINPDA